MGVDLHFLVPANPEQDAWRVGADIELERRRELWGPISDLPSKPIRRLRGYHSSDPDAEDGWGELLKDCYGSELRYVSASDIGRLTDMEAVRNNPKNTAAFAYVNALPPAWPVVLYWS